MTTELVTVHLFFYGLMAFVPNDSSPTSLQVLLVDARGHYYSSDGCKLPSHVPALYVKSAQCSVEGRAMPAGHHSKSGGDPCSPSSEVPRPIEPITGSWPLDGESLSLEVQLPAGERRRTLVLHRTESTGPALPATPEEGQDLAWIPQVPGPVDPNCLGSADDCPIVARFKIDDGEATSCRLFGRPEGSEITADDDITLEPDKVPAFEFKPLGAPEPLGVLAPKGRAMSTAVLVTLKVPRGAKIRIASNRLSESCRGRQPSRTIVLEAGTASNDIDVWVTNISYSHDHNMEDPNDFCADPGIDRHFELYYNLLARRVPFSQRSVPHSLMTRQSVESDAVQPTGDNACQFLRFDTDGRVPGEWRACGSAWLDGGG